VSFVRNVVVWMLVPFLGVLTAWSTLEGFSDSELTIGIVATISLLISYIIDQAIERARSSKLNALATRMGMQFDDNLSWIPFLTRTSNYACLEKTTVPFLNQCSGFRNVFVLNSEPAIFGCQYETGAGHYSTTIYRTVYRHRGDAVIDTDRIRETGWKIEIGEGFTIYYKEKYRTAPDAIREEYLQTQELHKSLRT
jgi:hypothetical protein